MSKSRKTMQDRIQFRPALQVLSMANASVGRIEKLLAICETRLNTVSSKADNPDELPNRDLQALVRMIVTLQKEWDKYAAILYSAEEVISSVDRRAMETFVADSKKENMFASSEPEDFNSTAILLRESMSALVQDLEALQVSGLSPSRNNDTSKLSGKKQAKKQNFSHTFFQKRPQATAF